MEDALRKRDRIHDLLPWHLNGTLGPEESDAFTAHLPGCAACRREMEAIGALRDEIAAHGETYFANHPAPETIVAAALRDPQVPQEQAEDVRRHLAFCSDCALEARWVVEGQTEQTGAAAPGTVGRASKVRAARGWAAAAAAVVLAGAAILFLPRSREGGRTDVVTPFYVDSIQRDASPWAVEVPAGEPAFALLLQVDAAPESLPLSLEIHDAAGRLVHRRDRVEALYRGAYLLVYCDRADFPDGEGYSARVASAGRPDLPPQEYRFRVVSAR